MTDNDAGAGTRLAGSDASAPGSLPWAKLSKFALPLIFAVVLLVVYSLSFVSPGLLDEQYLLSWLHDLPKLHGSSAASEFWLFPGLDPLDGWGLTTRLFLFFSSFILGKNIFLAKFVLLIWHGLATWLTYLCCREFTGKKSTSVIAACLFALYPLHFEATAWVGGIGSEISCVFFLLSLFLYLQGRQTNRGWGRIALCALAVFLAFAGSNLIWSSCFAFALCELVYLLLPDKNQKSRDRTICLISILLPVVITGACLAAGSGKAVLSLVKDLRFHDILNCLRHSFLPVNEMNWKHYAREYRLFYAVYPFLAIALACGSYLSTNLRRACTYFFLLFVVLFLPIAGIAAVQSNLYGERWLYAASAPLCMFLACAVSGLFELKGRFKIPGMAGGTIIACFLSFLFMQNLSNEIAAHRNLGRVLKAVQKSMKIWQEKDNLADFIVRDLPERISVCPLYSPRGPVLFDARVGLLRSNPLPDGRLKELLRQGKIAKSICRFDDLLKGVLGLDLGAEKANWTAVMSAEQLAAHMEPAVIFYKNVSLAADKSALLLESNSENGPAITLDPEGLSTVDGDYLQVSAQIDAPSSLAAPRLELHWQTRVHANYDKRERFSYVDALINDGKVHNYLLSLRSNAWTTGGTPSIMALGFPAGSRVRLVSAGLVRMEKNMMPDLRPVMQDCADTTVQRFTPPYFNYPVSSDLGMIALSRQANALEADWSVADINGARGALAELSYPDKNFQDANSNHLSGQTYKTIVLEGQSGKINIPVSSLPSSGVYSLRIIARDAQGAYLGQFSDPLCYQVPGTKED